MCVWGGGGGGGGRGVLPGKLERTPVLSRFSIKMTLKCPAFTGILWQKFAFTDDFGNGRPAFRELFCPKPHPSGRHIPVSPYRGVHPPPPHPGCGGGAPGDTSGLENVTNTSGLRVNVSANLLTLSCFTFFP